MNSNSPAKMEVIYKLADDLSAHTGMQEASLRPNDFGLRQTHGLVCSPEWWANIRSGSLETHTVRGVIRGIWYGQYHSGPAEFQMELSDGTFFGGHCYLSPEDADRAFTLGRIAEVDYVHQFSKATTDNDESPTAIWLEIRLGETSPNPVSPLPFTAENFGRFARNGRSTPHQIEAKRAWWAFWR